MKKNFEPIKFTIWEKDANIVLDIAILKVVIGHRYGKLQSIAEPSAEYITMSEPKNNNLERGQYFKFYLS